MNKIQTVSAWLIFQKKIFYRSFFFRNFRPTKLIPFTKAEIWNEDGFFSNLPKSMKLKKCAGRALSFVETTADR